MKNPIFWHQDNLKNRIDHYRSEREKAMSLLAICDKGEKENAFYQEQINEAVRRGMTEFDRDRLLVKRKPCSDFGAK